MTGWSCARVSALVHPSILPPTTIGSGGEKNGWEMWLPSGSVIDLSRFAPAGTEAKSELGVSYPLTSRMCGMSILSDPS